MIKPEMVERALELASKSRANYEYFFGNLTSPDWIRPLVARRWFSAPPEPVREGEYVRFPLWPESQYLKRMALVSPEQVHAVVVQIPETENLWVHCDLADAACKMPPRLAADWAGKETGWIRAKSYLHSPLPTRLGDLVIHLARGGEFDASFQLAFTLFELLPGHEAVEIEGTDFSLPPEPGARIDPWEYRELLGKVSPVLALVQGARTLTLLCDLLERSVRLSLRPGVAEGPDDYSFMWRPAIEDNPQNHRDDIPNTLVEAVRDVADTLIPQEGVSVLKVIEERPFKVFRRIGIHLRRRWPLIDFSGTEQLVKDEGVFEDLHLHHELFLLLEEHFERLGPSVQEKYLALVGRGIHEAAWQDFMVEDYGRRPSEAETGRHVRRWKLGKLWPIREHLRGEWREEFGRLQNEFGAPDHPDFHVWTSPLWIGPQSPLRQQELQRMSVEDILSYAKSWEPPTDPMSPSPQGLGRVLSELVTSKPEAFAEKAMSFTQVDPSYVGALIWGFRGAAEKNIPFPWEPVLELCHWLVRQPRQFRREREIQWDADRDWGSARKAIGDLVEVGLREGPSELPIRLRELVWAVLSELAQDPNPSLEDEVRYGGSNMDPATDSINTVRGQAMHDVVQYALWIVRRTGRPGDRERLIRRGFQDMPEVEAILDNGLDPVKEPTLAIRSVYGRWFPWLVMLDREWARNNVASIFPRDPDKVPLRESAWESYMVFCDPQSDVFEILEEDYEWAIGRLPTVPDERRQIVDPRRRLGEHLMTLYWHGMLNLDEPQGLLRDFFSKAPDSVRAEAIEFLGRSLEGVQVPLADDVAERLCRLWEWRVGEARTAERPEAYAKELGAFGWWFASAKFEDNWSLEQLQQALELGAELRHASHVVKRVARIAEATPRPATDCLKLLVKKTKETWEIHGWKDDAKRVLALGLGSSDGMAREAAEALVHTLGAMGFPEFRDLLRERG